MIFKARRRHPPCPHCGSGDVLPFEDDEGGGGDTTLLVIILSGILLLAGYFLFLVSSYLAFPLVVLVAIIATTRVINRHESGRPHDVEVLDPEHDYVCLTCSEFFKA